MTRDAWIDRARELLERVEPDSPLAAERDALLSATPERAQIVDAEIVQDGDDGDGDGDGDGDRPKLREFLDLKKRRVTISTVLDHAAGAVVGAAVDAADAKLSRVRGVDRGDLRSTLGRRFS